MAGVTFNHARMTIDPKVIEELDSLVAEEGSKAGNERWTKEAESILKMYADRGISTETLRKVMAKAFPKHEWSYAMIAGKLQRMAQEKR